MYKTYEIQDDTSRRDLVKANVKFDIGTIDYELEDYVRGDSANQKITKPISVTVYSDKQLKSGYSFYFSYPNHVIDIDFNQSGNGFTIDKANSSAGMMHIVVQNTQLKTYTFNCVTKYTANKLYPYANKKYSMSIDESSIQDKDGLTPNIELADSNYEFTYTTLDLLAMHNSTAQRDEAVIVNPVKNTFINIIKG